MTNQVEIIPAAKILDASKKGKGFVRLVGFAEPHAAWIREGGRYTRAWHYHWMYFFDINVDINVLGGKVSLTVKKIDLLTFLSHTYTYEYSSWDELFAKLSEIIEQERIDRLDMEKETIWTAK
jgi:hypothetical protein